ncbi:hypothetical protein BC938DRAFT_471818, partial [Jimgerdemannia flammicorona]
MTEHDNQYATSCLLVCSQKLGHVSRAVTRHSTMFKVLRKIHPKASTMALPLVRHYKLGMNAIKKGQVVELRDKVWKVTSKEHVVAGRGGAIVKMDMIELSSNNRISERFMSGDSLEVLNLKDENFQYLYNANGKVHLLNTETFEEVEMEEDMIEGGVKLLPMLE